MKDLTYANPSVGSFRCEPMTAIEIDAHPDADRIWATISAASRDVDAEVDREKAKLSGLADDALDEIGTARTKAELALQEAFDDALKSFGDQMDSATAALEEVL